MQLRPAFLVSLLGAAVGCAPSLSTFQPAHVAPRGHVEAGFGGEVSYPTGTVDTVVDAGKTLSKKASGSQPLTPAEKEELFDAGINLVVNPPSAGLHLNLAYSVIDDLEIGYRYAGSAHRLGARYQILRHERHPMDLVAGIGVSRFTFEIPIQDFIPVLRIDDFTRWQVDVPVLIGTSRSWGRVWAGPKLLLTKFSTSMVLDLIVEEDEIARFDGTAGYLGAQAGAAVGYRWAFFAVEITVARLVGSTSVSALGTKRDVSLSGTIIYPTFGLMLEI